MRRSTLFLAILMSLVTAPRADAQELNFWTQCVTAPFRACATVHIEAIYHPPEEMFLGNSIGISEVRYRVSNLTGLPGYEGGAHGLKQVRVFGFETVTGMGIDFFAEAISSSGSATIGAATDFPNLVYTGGGLASASFNLDYDSYLFGCNVPTGASPFAGYDQTCGGTITYGAYFVNDRLILRKDATAQLTWGGWVEGGTYNDDRIATVSCTTGADCTSVTPEPVTMTLMGTGMAGMAALRALRRRRKQPLA